MRDCRFHGNNTARSFIGTWKENSRITAMWNDERINEEPEYAPPSRKTLLVIMRRKIGRGLEARYEVPLDLPQELQELVAKLDS
jgi:hypothetical protein